MSAVWSAGAWVMDPHHTVAVVGGFIVVGLMLWGLGRELADYDEETKEGRS